MGQQDNKSLEMREIDIHTGQLKLSGNLCIPRLATGIVVFAHGSGSSRFSPRNQYVAEVLQSGNLATLLLDLLTDDEAKNRSKVFDIDLLAERLHQTTTWLSIQTQTRNLRPCYFGASTGAAAALVASARQPDEIAAVVSRGGRPDLADQYLSLVQSPTLLIVGGQDDQVIQLNEKALAMLQCPRQMVIVPGATHLFPEPGTLEEVAVLAKEWFTRYLSVIT